MSQTDGATSEDIDGFRYRVLMLDPLLAADIIADLGYVLAPVLGSIGGAFAVEKGDLLEKAMEGFDDGEGSSIDSAIERAVMGFFDRFSKEKQREIINIMARQTMVVMPDGNEPALKDIFSTHFRGRLKSLYRWLAFAMKTQFSDFFSGQDTAMSRVFAKAAAAVQ